MTTHKKIRIFLALLLTIAIAPLHSTTVYAHCHDGPSGPTISEDFNPLPVDFEWNPIPPSEMNKQDSIALQIFGGFPPYTWAVTGGGFSLENVQTWGTSNTLYSDATACATNITVTDNAGNVLSTNVVCPGEWVLVDSFFDPIVNNGCYIRYDYLTLCTDPPFENPEFNNDIKTVFGDCARMECCTEKGPPYDPPTGARLIYGPIEHYEYGGSGYCSPWATLLFEVFWFWQSEDVYQYNCY